VLRALFFLRALLLGAFFRFLVPLLHLPLLRCFLFVCFAICPRFCPPHLFLRAVVVAVPARFEWWMQQYTVLLPSYGASNVLVACAGVRVAVAPGVSLTPSATAASTPRIVRVSGAKPPN
jgi:hypothetical protein